MTEKYQNKTKIPKIVAFCALVVAVLWFSFELGVQSNAVENGALRITIDDITPSSVVYSIESNITYENALLIIAAYDSNDDLLDSKTEVQTIARGGIRNAKQVFSSVRFDNARVFLLDATTGIPLCACGEFVHQVAFIDYDGTLLSAQEVSHCQAATTPENPTRAGYNFTGWDRSYQDVQEDLTLRACYVKETIENLFSVSSASGRVGDEITVRVSLDGNVLLSGFDMKLFYDDSVLEYVSTDSELSMDVLEKHIAEEHCVLFNYLSAGENRTAGGAIADVTFRIKNRNQTAANLQLSPNSVVYVATEAEYGGNPIPTVCSLKDGVITIQ